MVAYFWADKRIFVELKPIAIYIKPIRSKCFRLLIGEIDIAQI